MSAAVTPDGAIEELEPRHLDKLVRFFAALPVEDLTFVKEEVTDEATLRSWTVAVAGEQRWVALGPAGDIAGFVAVLALPRWSDHVGELRLVVDPGHRRQGWGRRLARHALTAAVGAGLSKVQVEVVADSRDLLTMFEGLGFTAEALLRDQIRDRSGALRDLVLLAHDVTGTWQSMESIGLAAELDESGGA